MVAALIMDRPMIEQASSAICGSRRTATDVVTPERRADLVVGNL
jgi:hypothetical protein